MELRGEVVGECSPSGVGTLQVFVSKLSLEEELQSYLQESYSLIKLHVKMIRLIRPPSIHRAPECSFLQYKNKEAIFQNPTGLKMLNYISERKEKSP